MINRPKITDNIVYEINQLIKNNPNWTRTQISKELCEIWGWKNEAGTVCDISCRDMLRGLDAIGKISLPKAMKVGRVKGGYGEKVINIDHVTTPVIAPLAELRPLIIKIVTAKDDIMAFKSYIEKYHYLGYGRYIGENIKYAVYSRDGVPLASLMFGSSAWSCLPRDKFVGWNKEQRQTGLRYTTNNHRCLIYPWVRCDHLASHILGLICRRISCDWKVKYGHGLYMLETFVEQKRFRGSAYKAANWLKVGETAGRGRNSTTMQAILPIKDVYVYPLTKNFRGLLCRGVTP